MKSITMKITAYVLSFVILFISIFSAYNLSASAKTATTDDNGNNIIKILDMALNKTGISASQSTIQDFLGYMSDTVQDAYQTLEDTFNAAYDNVSDMVAAAKNSVSSSASAVPDSAKSLVNGYLDYMGKCFDTTANFKEGYTKGENFRNYLMSYVTDVDDKALVGAIGAKGSYKIGSELVGLIRQNMDAFIEEHEGYYLISTLTHKNVPASSYSSLSTYNAVVSTLKTISADGLYGYSGTVVGDRANIYLWNFDNINLICSSKNSEYFNVDLYSSDWKSTNAPIAFIKKDNNALNLSEVNWNSYSSTPRMLFPGFPFFSNQLSGSSFCLFTADGHAIKIWKSLDALKNYTVGQSNIYYSNTYSSFDSTVDNSISFTGKYYTTNEYSHTTIQNNIDNSQEINETTINNIVNNYITNNYYGTGDSDNPSDNPDSGNWFLDLITGIPQLLVAIIDGLTALVESGGKLLEGIVNLFTKLFVPSEGFAEPLFDKVNNKFTFKEQSETNVNLVFDQLSTMGQSVPTVTFPFSKTSLAKYGVEDITVSFDWYAPYKPTVDVIFSAILWVMFAFNQYFAVKNIINASGSAVDIASHL